MNYIDISKIVKYLAANHKITIHTRSAVSFFQSLNYFGIIMVIFHLNIFFFVSFTTYAQKMQIKK